MDDTGEWNRTKLAVYLKKNCTNAPGKGCWCSNLPIHGYLTRYVKLLVAHAPGMPGTFSTPPRVSDPDMHHGTCATHVSWCKPGLLTSGFLWSRWRGKRSRHSRCMRNPQFYVSGKRSMSSYSILAGRRIGSLYTIHRGYLAKLDDPDLRFQKSGWLYMSNSSGLWVRHHGFNQCNFKLDHRTEVHLS